jgi:chaperone modulatory protein CbpM
MVLTIEEVVTQLTRGGAEVTTTEVTRFVSQGWVLATRGPQGLSFDEADTARVKLICELRQDLAVNDEAVPIVLKLLDQVYSLRDTMRGLREAIEHLPPELQAELERLMTLPANERDPLDRDQV